MSTDTQKALCKLLKGDYRNESSLELVRRVEGLVDALRRERDDALQRVQALIEIATAPDTTQPQLSEIRYVLHGDIQPCSVLYSDDTTTLLRLDEGDMMCETDTIEWSDSVTYRCQELLREAGVRSLGHVAPRLAQLVRDERILLNDNGDDEAVETFVPTLDERTQPVSQADLCPQCHTPKQER